MISKLRIKSYSIWIYCWFRRKSRLSN